MRTLQQTWVLFQSHLLETLRNIVWTLVSLFEPVCYLLLFFPLLKGMAGSLSFFQGDVLDFFVPGLLIMITIYSVMTSGMSVIGQIRDGVFEQWQVSPSSRLAMTLSLLLRDVLNTMVRIGILLLVASFMGLTFSWLGLFMTLLLIILIVTFLSSVSYALACSIRDEGSLAALTNFLVLPLMLLSGILMPLELSSSNVISFLGTINPFTYIVDASRALMIGNVSATAVGISFVLSGVLALLGIGWATITFKKLNL